MLRLGSWIRWSQWVWGLDADGKHRQVLHDWSWRAISVARLGFFDDRRSLGFSFRFFSFFTSHLRHDTPRHTFFWDTGQDHIGYIYRHDWDDTEPR